MESVFIQCPVCDHGAVYEIEKYEIDTYPNRALIVCDSESGGCEEVFVAQIKRVYETKTFVLKGKDNGK